MAITEFSAALNQVATERGIPVKSVLDSVKSALLTAYKKDRKVRRLMKKAIGRCLDLWD